MASEPQTLGTQAAERHRGSNPGVVAVVGGPIVPRDLDPARLVSRSRHLDPILSPGRLAPHPQKAKKE